jgi:hypothetical protein
VTFGVTNLTLANGSFMVTNIPATNADAGAIFNDAGTVTLADCVLINNSAQCVGIAQGGAIFNNGGLVTLLGTTVASNSATGSGMITSTNLGLYDAGAGYGGALFTTNGTVNIVNCMFDNNSSSGAGAVAMGGAVYQASGVLAISNTFFATNSVLASAFNFRGSENYSPGVPSYGGALSVDSGSAGIDHCQFAGNSAQGGSGGGASGSGASAEAIGGAIYNAATLIVGYSSFCGNATSAGVNYLGTGASGLGGAIYNSGTAQVNCCAVYSNVTQGGGGEIINETEMPAGGGSGLGGGIYNASQLAITNCTIALNSSVSGSGDVTGTGGFFPDGPNGSALGGGIFNGSGATITAMNATIASNSCVQGSWSFGSVSPVIGFFSGIEIANSNGVFHMHNSLIAGTNDNAYGPITDDGYNICSDGSANMDSGSSYNFTDPQLAPLGSYGGPTLCMALLPTSPAISYCDPFDFPPVDQRGYPRPGSEGPTAGAYEYGTAAPITLVLTLYPSTASATVSFNVTATNTYWLQYSSNLVHWVNLSTNPPLGYATNILETFSPTQAQGFFRLLVQ